MKVIIIFCFALLTGLPAYAQDTLYNDANAKAQAITLKFKRELQLNVGQEKEVHALLETYFKNIEQVKAGLESQAKKTIHKQSMEEFEQILTESQYLKFIALREQNREQKEEFKRNHPDYRFSEEDEELDF